MKEIRYIMLGTGILMWIAAFVAATIAIFNHSTIGMMCYPIAWITAIVGLMFVVFSPDAK